MFRFGFKKKWRSDKESKEPEQPASTNGIKLLTFRAIDNEFASKPPVPEYSVPTRTRVKRNVMEVFRQSYPNFPTIRNGENNSYEPVQFRTVQFSKEISNERNETTPSLESEEKSTLIFMTEDHGDTNREENESIVEDIEVNLGAAFEQRRIQKDEIIASVDQEQELEDIYGARKVPMQEEKATELRSNSDEDSNEDEETVELDNETSDLGEDNFRIHVAQHANDAISTISYQSGDTLLDTASILQEERPKFRFDDYYNFGESQTDEKLAEHTYISESNDDMNFQININNKQDEQQINFDESVDNNQSEQVEKRVKFDVSDNEESIKKTKIKGKIITTPQRKETLEDIKLKPGYSLQASALFFSADNNDGNDSDTSA